MSDGYNQVRDRRSTRALEWVMYAAAWCFRAATRPFSVWSVSRFFGALGSWLVLIIPAFRRRAADNLELIYPEMPPPERRRLVQETARSFIHLGVEYTHFDRFISTMEIETEGMEHLRAAHDSGLGAIIVTAHFGNWEAIRMAGKRAGHELGIIYRAFNNRYLDRDTMSMIPGAGAPVLQKGGGLRQLLQHVRQGGMIMILVDQRNSGAPFIDFMGQPAETVTTAAELAIKTGAALIPARAVRDLENRRFNVRFEKPVSGTEPTVMMAEVNRRIGAWIAEQPAQWFWFHRRWKSNARSVSRDQ